MHDLRKKYDIGELLRANAVTIMFVVLCIICLIFSGQTVPYVMYELFGRLSRNAFIVLALILPIIAGMGINFAITIGAMAAQISALWVIEWGISGLGGFLVAMLMTVPIAGFFGYLIGNLLNKMKGQEMIGGLILGYFANGLYQLLFLFIFGNLIPLNAPGLVIKGSTGVANTIDLSTDRGFKYALDGIWNVPFGTGLYIFCGLFVVYAVAKLLLKKSDKKKTLVTVPDSRHFCPLCHGQGAYGHLPGGGAAVPVQQCSDEDPSGSAVPGGWPEPDGCQRLRHQRG